MRRAVLLLALYLSLAPLSFAAGNPVLRAVTKQPLQVHGLNFRPAERVTVRVLWREGVRVHFVRATSAGTFTTTFTAVSIEPCTPYVVTARGSGGSRAVLRPPRFVDCAQP
jgi:hypothetical protein